ncbi:MAG: hypothetical protein V3U84_03795 [Thiotrichaceae bacterium]
MTSLLKFIVISIVVIFNATAAPLAKKDVPEPLKPWVDWVLYEQDQQMCPHAYNGKQRFCAWPSSLKLELNNQQGEFSQHWQVQSETWVRLPGNAQQWPHDVEVDSIAAVVVNRQGFPTVKLFPGEHEVSGGFQWDSIPESLTIPPATGLFEISRNGEAIEFPRINQQGQLWLDKSIQQKDVQDAMDVQVYRKIVDGHPMQIETRFILNVSGRSRDVVFSDVQLDRFIALNLISKLPARINQQGDLQVQVRPGNWQIDLVSYNPNIVESLTLPARDAVDGLPEQEVWVFQAKPSLRLTEISGVPSIDSRQTRLPNKWQQYPAYLLSSNLEPPKQTLKLKTLQRGSASPEPNRLTLNRTMWMDFSGDGFTIDDKISGIMTRGWRLVTASELDLGSVRIDDEPQFITTLKGSVDGVGGTDKGVEVRRGEIDLQAASRYTESVSSIPVTGWKHDFQRVSTRLFLPPGWKLFSAHGADNLPNTWLQRWTLLDLFMVLVIAVAIGRLWDWKWGVFALLTMTLIWHEVGAPKYIWLNLIAAIALLRVLPEGLAKKLVWMYRNAVFLGLLLIVIPFIVSEVRQGLYPQLGIYADYDRAVYSSGFENEIASRVAEDATMEYDKLEKKMNSRVSEMMQSSSPAPAPRSKGKGGYNSKFNQGANQSATQMANQIVDPNANIQTGPGLPTWNWQEVLFQWNSPVNEAQTLRLNLIGPKTNLVLNFLRVILLLLLMSRLIRVFIKDNNKDGNSKKPLHRFSKSLKGLSAIALPLLLITLLMPDAHAEKLVKPIAKTANISNATSKNGFPDEAMLQALKSRLLAADKCLPDCAQIEAMRIELNEEQLTLYVKIHSAAVDNQAVAVPLPGNSEQWRAETVLLANQPAKSLSRDQQGVLWIGLNKGIHNVVMQGRLPKQPQVQLSLPLLPKYVEWNGEGWTVEGVRDNHMPAQQLQLIRKQSAELATLDKNNLAAENNILPPLLHVQRTLHLGLDWMVETRVSRLSPTGSPVSMKIPLLKNESVLSNKYPVKKAHVMINMSSMQRSISWNSHIPVADKLLLEATHTSGLVESWKLDISPIWHVEITGIPEIHHGNQADAWLPEWQPWPGEKVSLAISRPEGVAGRTLTIDRSILSIKVGKRIRESKLSLNLRSSRGGQHVITLPENSELVSVNINDSLQPIRQQGRKVSLPIVPGEQRIVAKWRVDTPIHTRLTVLPVDVGVDNVNNSIHLGMGRDRWVLFTNGPQMGPAVLFWGVLLVVLIASVILGRIKESPLKTWQWFLLGTGLILATPIMILVVAGWLLAMNYRPKLQSVESRLLFNGGQVLLVILTIVAFGTLMITLRQGLLGWPDMQISGNSSTAWQLRWFQDRSSAQLPQPWVISVPLLVYRILMLLWALWLAFSLISWLRDGWHNFTVGGLWRSAPEETKKEAKKQKSDSKSAENGS